MSKKQSAVLIAEDNAEIAKLIKLYLEGEGYKTVWAEDGAAGLAALIVSGILSSCRISLGDKLAKGSLFVRVGAVALVVFAVIVFGAYGPGDLPPDPIYGGF